MHKKLFSLVVVTLSMMMSLVLAVPASAADPLPYKDPVKTTTNPWYYNTIPYETITDIDAPGTAVEKVKYDDAYFRKRLGIVDPVPQPTKTTDTKGRHVKGRPLQPSVTAVVPKSVMTPKPPPSLGGLGYMGGTVLGAMGNMLGPMGIGMGGKATVPTNAEQLFDNLGVSHSCRGDNSACTQAELKNILDINGCSLTAGACEALGAQVDDSTDVVAFDGDLWSILTDQAEQDEREELTGLNPEIRCIKNVHFVHDGPGTSTGRVVVESTEIIKKTGTYFSQSDCRDTYALTMTNSTRHTYSTTCLGPDGRSVDANGAQRGLTAGSSLISGSTDTKPGTALCSKPDSVLQSVRLYSTADFAACATNTCYSFLRYTEWINPDPTIHTVLDTTVSTNFRCQDALGGIRSYSVSLTGSSGYPAAVCPQGSDLVDYNVNTSTGDGKDNRDLGGAEVNQTELEKYPDCISGPCALSIRLDGQTCGVGIENCEKWPAISAKQPSRLKCEWGPYVVPLSDCYPLANAYLTESGLIRDPRSQTYVPMDRYGKPLEVINPEPWNPTNPNPKPGEVPGTEIEVHPGESTFPLEGTNPDGTTCLASNWSWNPVHWVMAPVSCALTAAFVPDPAALDTYTDQVVTKLDSKGILPTALATGAMFGVVAADAAGAGCRGPGAYFPPLDQTFYFFDACSAPMSHVANISSAIIGFSVVGFGALTAVRSVAAAFGYNWTLGRGGSGDN